MRFISLFFVLIIFCNLSCKISDKRFITPGSLSKEDSMFTVVDSAGIPGYIFRFAPPDGKTYSYTVETKAAVTQKVKGKEMETTSNNKVVFHYQTQKDVTGNIKIYLTYDDFKLSGKTGDDEIDIDATTAEEDSEEHLFSVLKGATFTIEASPNGSIKKITGVEELVDTMYKLAGANPNDMNLIKSIAAKIINPESLKQFLSSDYSGFPTKPIYVGDSWKINATTLQSDFKFPITITYTLASIENRIATIELSSDIKLENQELEMQGYKVMTNFSGTQQGEIVIDMVTGTVRKSEQELKLKGKFEILGTEVPVSIKYTYSLTKNK